MYHVKLARMLSNTHTMLLLMTFSAKLMFKVNKPLFISKQTMDVCGKIFHGLSNNVLPHQGIFCDVAKYSTMSLNNIHVVE
jgi:hypothetical protein